MEKPCHSSATHHSSSSSSSSSSTSSTTTTTSGTSVTGTTANTDNPIPVSIGSKTSSNRGNSSSNSAAASAHIQSSLRSLNRASYKISKPLLSSNPTSAIPVSSPSPPLPPPAPAVGSEGAGAGGGGAAPPQPPVYNIDKNDFRDVVQKLTGSPAHHQIRPAPPPPLAPPAVSPPTSRLHRIRPPPLAHLAPRPPPLVPAAAQPPMAAVDPWTLPPLSPLPPLPTVTGAAESPISAYMRHLHSGGLAGLLPSPTAVPALPSSQLGFGCVPSPRTAYQMMATTPGLVFPTSPGVQVPSPRLGDP